MSFSGGHGGVPGLEGAPAKVKDKEEDDTESIIKRENIDFNTVDEVIRLIMERGIAR